MQFINETGTENLSIYKCRRGIKSYCDRTHIIHCQPLTECVLCFCLFCQSVQFLPICSFYTRHSFVKLSPKLYLSAAIYSISNFFKCSLCAYIKLHTYIHFLMLKIVSQEVLVYFHAGEEELVLGKHSLCWVWRRAGMFTSSTIPGKPAEHGAQPHNPP